MLIGEGELLDLQEVGVPQQAVQVDTQRVPSPSLSSAYTISEAVRMVALEVELFSQLVVHRFDRDCQVIV